MTKPIEGVSEKILACAKEEFLEKGYSEASLRTIAAKADTTTGSIYSRFRDKEGLFGAIVEPAAEGADPDISEDTGGISCQGGRGSAEGDGDVCGFWNGRNAGLCLRSL